MSRRAVSLFLILLAIGVGAVPTLPVDRSSPVGVTGRLHTLREAGEVGLPASFCSGCFSSAPLAFAPKAGPMPAPPSDRAVIADALPTEEEVKMGRDGAAQAEREFKLVTDAEPVKRVESIGWEIVRASEDPKLVAEFLRDHPRFRARPGKKHVPFNYSFKILRSREVNAFSFAGGPIYVTSGLLDYVRSDHELAGVLAHEVAHVARRHLVQLVDRASRTEKQMLWLLLAGLLAGGASSPDFGNVLVGAQLYSIAKQTGYGRELERDADRAGVQYMLRTKYNPVGMLTVMKRFARDEARAPTRDLGIYQSHPYPRERARLLSEQLEEAGVRVDVGVERDITRAFVFTTQAHTENGKEIGELALNGEIILRVARPEHGRTPVERAEKIRRDLEQRFEENLTLPQIRLSADERQVLVRGVPVITVYPEDAGATGHSVPETARRILRAIQQALWAEQIDLTF